MEQQGGEMDRYERLIASIDRLIPELAAWNTKSHASPPGATSNTQIIKVDAGGWGILIALVMVAFLAGLNIAMSARQVTMAGDVNEIRRKQDRDDDYINSMFRILPELKQRFDHEKEQEQREHPDHHQP